MQEHWGLATGGPLAQYFEARGLDHPDDMAAVILTSLWRTLHYRSIRLDEQIAWYRATRGTVPLTPANTPARSTVARVGPIRSHRVHSDERRERAREPLPNIRTGGCVEMGWRPESS